MKSNFIFLKEEVPELYQLGRLAEKYLYSDSNACLLKLGLFGETLVHLIMRLNFVEPPKMENTHANRILTFKRSTSLVGALGLLGFFDSVACMPPSAFSSHPVFSGISNCCDAADPLPSSSAMLLLFLLLSLFFLLSFPSSFHPFLYYTIFSVELNVTFGVLYQFWSQ